MSCRIKDAQNHLKKTGWRLDIAIDNFYNSPQPVSPFGGSSKQTTDVKKIESLFDQYKGELIFTFLQSMLFVSSAQDGFKADFLLDGDVIGIDGTLSFCKDLGVDPEDVVMLAVAYELKSPSVGVWTRQGWLDGWKKLEWAPFIPILLFWPQPI